MNEVIYIGRQRDKEGKSECALHGAECGNVVVHLLWECSAYTNIFFGFKELFGDRYVNSGKLNSIEETLGSELWEYDFEHLLSLVKEYPV